MIGSTIGSYKITGLLGEGGMGAVYRATDNIEREVAIKALHSQLTRDESRLARFRSEAIALGRLQHPNIATLYHLLEQNGDYFMVMEFVQGQTLEDIVRTRGALSPQMALAVFNEGLKGFEHAHSKGVIHRDIKPSNLMVSRDGVTKITDFGIARMAGSGRMTQTGKVIGTLEYMSPEQVRGQEQDARSDIYSLGILLFELLTGRMPFSATSDYDIMRAHLEEVPPPARSIVATLPAGLDAAIAKALAKDPAARFQSVSEMRSELEAIARELPAPPAPATLVLDATREASAPVAPPQNSQGQPSVPAHVPVSSVPPQPRTPAPLPKWAIPVAASAGALVLLGGLWSLGALRSPGSEAVPTPVAASQFAGASNAPSEAESSAPEVTTDTISKSPEVTTPIEVPSSIPALEDAPATKPPTVQPPVAPTPSATRPRAVERESSTSTVERPSSDDIATVKRRYQGWLSAWQQMDDLDGYMSYYWRGVIQRRAGKKPYGFTQQRQLMAKNWAGQSFISISNEEPEVSVDGDSIVVSANQSYDSTKWWDEGRKHLTWRKKEGEWVIVEESFDQRDGGAK